jgi:hypothetical protein
MNPETTAKSIKISLALEAEYMGNTGNLSCMLRIKENRGIRYFEFVVKESI